MLRSEYIMAIEARLRWMRWGQSRAVQEMRAQHGMRQIALTYDDILETADTFFMERHFCALIDEARLTVPDTLAFEAAWMQAKRGWLWVQEPFLVPETEGAALATASGEFEIVPVRIRALGWREIPEGEWLVPVNGPPEIAPAGCIQFCMYADGASFPQIGQAAIKAKQLGLDKMIAPGDWTVPIEWWPWAYFVLRDGDRLGMRLEQFERLGREENPAGAYVPIGERLGHPLHEMRWLYTALHTMAQKLAVTVTHPVDRHTRRRAERTGQEAPPIIRVVTLRRLEQDRRADPRGSNVDWAWHWSVIPHWRNQFYSSTGEHKQVLIESYIKGNLAKPFKPPGHKLFVARR